MTTAPPNRPRLPGLALLLVLGACSGGGAEIDVAALDLVGTRIDGSEDPVTSTALSAPIGELDSEVAEAGSEPGEPGALDSADDASDGANGANGASGQGLTAVDVGDDGAADTGGDAPTPEEVGRLRDDGVREISFWDLSLEGHDKEALVDSLIFPEDYEDQDLLPAEVRGLSGQRIALTGYMIPGRIARGGDVRDFMLVRDLLGCCFGGIPQPDEWIDVTMEEDVSAEYVRYVPIEVVGTFAVGEEMDENAFNPAIFKMVATGVERVE